MPALFITLEGIEGVGKSTIAYHMHRWLEARKISSVLTREPGGTEIAEAIRRVLLYPYQEKMADDTELLLMFAGRAQHLSQIILPALQAQKWVLCDRFTDASYAYQGAGRGMSFERIAQLEAFVHPQIKPDKTFLFTAPVAVALERAKGRAHSPDRFELEQLEFFERAQNAYLKLAEQAPQRFCVIDTAQPLKAVLENVETEFEGLLNTFPIY